MAFKRVRHSDTHEVIFGAFIPELNKGNFPLLIYY